MGAASVISPIELLRTKLQSEKLSYRQLGTCVRRAVGAEGWLSLWRGLGPTLLRDVPFSAMYWYNYERGKRWLCQRYGTEEPTFAMTFVSGATSGTVSAMGRNRTREAHSFILFPDVVAVVQLNKSCLAF